MIATLTTIVEILLGCGLAGLLMILGGIAVISWICKQIIVNIYYAIHTSKKRIKGGDDK